MIRERATVRVAEVVRLAYESVTIDELVARLGSLDNRFTTGLLDLSQPPFDWESALRKGDASAFSHVLGPYVSAHSFEFALSALPSPAHYALSMGYGVWADKALLIYCSAQLHGPSLFRRNDV